MTGEAQGLALVCIDDSVLAAACASELGSAGDVIARGFLAAGPATLGATSADVSRSLAEVEADRGPVTSAVLALPAPDPRSATAATLTPAQWVTGVERGLTRAFTITQVLAQRMIARRHGAITFVTSLDAIGGAAGHAVSCAVSAGLVGFMKTSAIEWGRFGVRLNLIAAPLHLSERELALLADRTPISTETLPSDVAQAIAFSISPAAHTVTGTVITVDGGSTSGLITRWKGEDLASTSLLDRRLYTVREG